MYYSFEKRDIPFQIWDDSVGLTPNPHIHPELELIYMTEGQSIAFADGVSAVLDAGDIYLAFPNQIHYYLDQGPTKQYIFVISADLFPALKALFQAKVPLSPVIKKSDLPPDTDQWLSRITAHYNADSKLSRAALYGYTQGFLAELLEHMELTDNSGGTDSIKQILLYCIENYTEPLTLDTLARDLHLSKYYISHVFSNRLELSFPEFINGLRVEHACRHMSQTDSITQLAFDAGFSSVRTFNRNFERIMGMTPSAYRNQRHMETTKERTDKP